MKNEEIKKELLGLSKTLAHMPKTERKQIPDGYFDKLPDDTWDKITSEQIHLSEQKTTVIPLVGKLIGVAASFTLLFFMISSINKVQPAEEISTDTMVEYIIDDLGQLDEDFLLEFDLESSSLVELDDESLDYMLEEEIDLIDDKILETLFEEL